MRLRRSPEVTFEVVDGRAILIDGQGTELITLNPVGTLVWNALDGERDSGQLANDLVATFEDVTVEQLEDDINAFVEELRSSGLVVEADAAR